jgi:hypothetical protein
MNKIILTLWLLLLRLAPAGADDVPIPIPASAITELPADDPLLDRPAIADPPPPASPAKPKPRKADTTVPHPTELVVIKPKPIELEITTTGLTIDTGTTCQGLCGDRIDFTVNITQGECKSCKWLVLPAGAQSGLKPSGNGLSADFVTRKAGTYQFFVSVAGSDGSVAHAVKQVELQIDPEWSRPLASVSDDQNISRGTSNNGEISIRDRVCEWTDDVKSPAKQAESRVIAGVIRRTVRQFEAGQTAAGADLVAMARQASAQALGQSYPAWEGWFNRFEGMRSRAAAGSADGRKLALLPSNQAYALKQVAAALEQ